MKVKVKKLHPDAKLPVYSTEGAACFDISGVELDGIPSMDARQLFTDDRTVIRTGLSFEVPKDHVMLVFSRSGHGFKENVRLSNCVGVIDSDYRGELMVKLIKDAPSHNTIISKGDRIAQAMIIPVQQVQFELADELSDTQRGVNGLGSTGV